ncbi:asparaginase [Tamaricihabitans halophyticus]|uniref:Asparaginase n=1 Tax=Tamaricihabitans halophyticus TaxID=1262583 RepID=A0A4R2QW82_9PSEU|nr:asparaginase [Tamaricihabitans halophyticus]TCP54343.1 asparaginase [Tamaricihabitans halophyticus]
MNPVLAEVERNGVVESVHRGTVLVLDPDGKPLRELGDPYAPFLPRSSAKPMQALAMLRAGLSVPAADLALISASHSGEAEHVRRVLALLDTFGFAEEDLKCPVGPHDGRKATMNCSGKHAGMLATCAVNGWDPARYLEPEHPLQRAIAATITELTGEPIALSAVDGCGAPLFGYSPAGLCSAFRQLVDTEVAAAMRANPFLVAGTGREDTVLLEEVDGLLLKGGAEGVHAFALADGTAAVFKIDDGAARARPTVLLALLEELGITLSERARGIVEPVYGGGAEVGAIRPGPELANLKERDHGAHPRGR